MMERNKKKQKIKKIEKVNSYLSKAKEISTFTPAPLPLDLN
jgi:hypothetical protein